MTVSKKEAATLIYIEPITVELFIGKRRNEIENNPIGEAEKITQVFNWSLIFIGAGRGTSI